VVFPARVFHVKSRVSCGLIPLLVVVYSPSFITHSAPAASLLAPPLRPQLDSAAGARGGGAVIVVQLLRPAPGSCTIVREEALLPTATVRAPPLPPASGSSAGEPAWGGRHPEQSKSRRGGADTLLRAGFGRRGSSSAMPTSAVSTPAPEAHRTVAGGEIRRC
jgi:hypothetical protein